MKYFLKNKKAFTLIELLVVVGIIAVIAGIGGDMFATVMRTYRKAELYSLTDKVASGILTQLEQDIRLAIELDVNPNGDSVDLYIPKSGSILKKTYTFSSCTQDTANGLGYINYSVGNSTPSNLVIESTENIFNEQVYVKKIDTGNFITRIKDPTQGYDLVYVSFIIAVGVQPGETNGCTNPDNEVYMLSSINLRGGLE